MITKYEINANSDRVPLHLSMPVPLPEAQSEYFGPANFAWLIRGRLAGMSRPGLTHSIETDVEALMRIGIDTVFSLTDEWSPPESMTSVDGLDVHHVPIPDMAAPTMEQAFKACEMAADAVSRGHSIVFHCHAGRGRTGTMLAAMLIWYAPDSKSAIDHTKSINSAWIETEVQMNFLADFAAERRKRLNLLQKAESDGRPVEISHVSQWRIKEIFHRQLNPGGSNAPLPENSSTKEDEMSLDKALQTAMSGVPECLASGYVDMDTGMLLGVHTMDSHPQEVLDVLAAATADLFQGSSVVEIENMFKKSRGTEKDESHYFHEIFVFSENLLHVFMRTKKYPGHVVGFVCRKSANPGMVLTKARASLEKVTAAV